MGEASSAPRIKLRNIGMTFADIRRGPEQPAFLKDNTAEEQTPEQKEEGAKFTEDELSRQWTLMCNRMPQRLVGLAARLKNINPHITDYPNVEAVIDNEIFLGQLQDIRTRICATLRQTLNNPNIDFTLRLAKAEDAKRTFTKRELFDDLRQKNPAIEKLRTTLGLELA